MKNAFTKEDMLHAWMHSNNNQHDFETWIREYLKEKEIHS